MSWRKRARCATEIGPIFERLDLAAQRTICGGCPVRDDCLVDALERELPLGSGMRRPAALPDTLRGGLAGPTRCGLEGRILAETARVSRALLVWDLVPTVTPDQLDRIHAAAESNPGQQDTTAAA